MKQNGIRNVSLSKIQKLIQATVKVENIIIRKKNMSFLRLKMIEIGFTLPQAWSNKIYGKNIRFYVSGNDLFYLSKFKLWDPEQGGGSGLKYPTQRVFNIGIQMTL